MRKVVIVNNKTQRQGIVFYHKNFSVFMIHSYREYCLKLRVHIDIVFFDFDLIADGKVLSPEQFVAKSGNIPFIVMASEKNIRFATKILHYGITDIIAMPCCEPYFVQILNKYSLNKCKISCYFMGLSFFDCKKKQTEASVLAQFVGTSLHAQKVRDQINWAAKNNLPVLILGETGTGKSLVAKLIHQLSSRKNYAFVVENVTAVQDSLIEGEFFGTQVGAYTDATNKCGLFEFANRGSLFLDEVGGMSMSMQSKLLEVLETGEYRRVGEVKKRKTDFRLMCATNISISELKESTIFRSDLYYRISGCQIQLLPLRKRVEDIAPLVQYFLHGFALRSEKKKILVPTALEKLQNHLWTGNIRELHNCIHRAFYQSRGSYIAPDDITFIP